MASDQNANRPFKDCYVDYIQGYSLSSFNQCCFNFQGVSLFLFSVCRAIFLSVCLPAFQFVSLSTCDSACLCVCRYVYLQVYFFYLSLYFPSVPFFSYLSLGLSVFLFLAFASSSLSLSSTVKQISFSINGASKLLNYHTRIFYSTF